MKTKARKEFDREFKLGTVALVVAEGKPMTQNEVSGDKRSQSRLPHWVYVPSLRRIKKRLLRVG